jgi:hypothetical protein
VEEGKGDDKVSKNDDDNNNNNNNINNDQTTTMLKSTKKMDTMMMSRNIVNGATCLTWSPDGRRFAIGLLDGGVLIRAMEHPNSWEEEKEEEEGRCHHHCRPLLRLV